MRVTARELAIAGMAMAVGCTATIAARPPAPDMLGPAVFDWAAMPVVRGDTGETRAIVRRPTATLRELEMHVTTLRPGIASHPPHRHPNEEIVIIDRGTVETLSDGVWKRVGPGSVIFNASNALHALRNVGAEPAQYHVVNWTSDRTPRS